MVPPRYPEMVARSCADRRRKGSGGKPRTMNVKKITRNPLMYVLLIGILLIVGFSLITSLGGAKQITTQQGLDLLQVQLLSIVSITFPVPPVTAYCC